MKAFRILAESNVHIRTVSLPAGTNDTSSSTTRRNKWWTVSVTFFLPSVVVSLSLEKGRWWYMVLWRKQKIFKGLYIHIYQLKENNEVSHKSSHIRLVTANLWLAKKKQKKNGRDVPYLLVFPILFWFIFRVRFICLCAFLIPIVMHVLYLKTIPLTSTGNKWWST